MPFLISQECVVEFVSPTVTWEDGPWWHWRQTIGLHRAIGLSNVQVVHSVCSPVVPEGHPKHDPLDSSGKQKNCSWGGSLSQPDQMAWIWHLNPGAENQKLKATAVIATYCSNNQGEIAPAWTDPKDTPLHRCLLPTLTALAQTCGRPTFLSYVPVCLVHQPPAVLVPRRRRR